MSRHNHNSTSVREALEQYPRLELGNFPTPVREMARLRQHLGCAPRLWIKNDDYSGPGFGGNKVRKLEYVLAKAVADGAEEVFTTGGINSNHARITAALCARLGLGCQLVLNIPPSQPGPERGRPASLLIDEMFGAQIHFVEKREARAPEMQRLADVAAKQGKRVCVVPLGASTPLGALGFVRAAAEFAEQASMMKLNIAGIVLATSSGGTQAGLVVGVRAFGPDSAKVIGISVDDPAAQKIEEIKEIVHGTNEMLSFPADFPESRIEVDGRFTGDGYGIPSKEGNNAIAILARTEGVILDPVYTGKAMAGFIHLAKTYGYTIDQDFVFWHTGGQLALFQEVSNTPI